MVYAVQASEAFKKTRAFFKGNLKSANKRYTGDDGQSVAPQLAKERGISLEDAELNIEWHNSNQLKADELISQERQTSKQGSPIGLGHDRYNAGMAYGNCGEMACVAMYIGFALGVPPDAMVLVTAYNKKNTKGLFGSTHMTFGHSWAQFGPDDDGWVIDP